MIKSRELLCDWGMGDAYFRQPMSGGYAHVYCPTDQCTEDYIISKHYWGSENCTMRYGEFNFRPGSEYLYCTENKRPRMNNCDHKRNVAVNYAYTGVVLSGRVRLRNPPWYYASFPTFFREPNVQPFVEQVENHPSIDISAAQRTAWHTMQEEFEGNVSMLNFLFELKDFKDIMRFLKNKPLDKLSNYVRRQEHKRRSRKRKLRDSDPTAGIATAHLTWNFAVRPLISDVIDITKQLSQVVEDAQNQFKLKGLEGNTRHYSQEWVISDSLDWGPLPYGYSHKRSGELFKTQFCATMDYSFDYSMRSAYDAFRRYWGLELNAEVLWNAAIGSFLVDYFFNIGQTLSVMRHDRNVNLFLHQYCESLKTAREAGVFIDADVHASPVAINNKIASGVNLLTGSHSGVYTRKVTIPNKGAVMPTFSMPTQPQWLNIAALTRMLL